MATDLDFDFDAMIAARDRFHDKLHNLNPSEIDLRADGGFLGGFELFDSDRDLTAWFAFRRDLLMQYYRRQHEAFTQFPRLCRLVLDRVCRVSRRSTVMISKLWLSFMISFCQSYISFIEGLTAFMEPLVDTSKH